jgi:hypothetical protein
VVASLPQPQQLVQHVDVLPPTTACTACTCRHFFGFVLHLLQRLNSLRLNLQQQQQTFISHTAAHVHASRCCASTMVHSSKPQPRQQPQQQQQQQQQRRHVTQLQQCFLK